MKFTQITKTQPDALGASQPINEPVIPINSSQAGQSQSSTRPANNWPFRNQHLALGFATAVVVTHEPDLPPAEAPRQPPSAPLANALGAHHVPQRLPTAAQCEERRWGE